MTIKRHVGGRKGLPCWLRFRGGSKALYLGEGQLCWLLLKDGSNGLYLGKASHHQKNKKGSLWNPNTFLNMPNLKFLRVRNINLLHVPTQLSNNFKFIEWSDYPSKSLPYFQPNELVQLHLRRSKIVILWEGKKVRVLISIFIQI